MASNGIFGPGGLLATLYQQEQDQLKIDSGSDSVQVTTDLTSSKLTATADCENSDCSHSIPKKQKLCDLEESPAPAGSHVVNKLEVSAVSEAELTSNDISPAEAAFSIDHILESILDYIPRHLTKARLVSHRFNRISTKLLQKYLKISIDIPGELEVSVTRYALIKVSNNFGLTKRVDSLQTLNFVLRNATETFPCVRFFLFTDKIDLPQIQNFLETYGPSIKMLSLNTTYNFKTIAEENILAELQTLLVKKIPNLLQLVINISTPTPIPMPPTLIADQDGNHNEMQMSTVETSEAKKKNDEQLQDQKENFNLPYLKSLTVQHCSFTVFKKVLDASVNLRTYRTSELASHPLSKDILNYFIDGPGISRLHLVKHVGFDIRPDKSSLHMLDLIAELTEKNDSLRIQFLRIGCSCVVVSPHLWPQVSSSINRILRGTAKHVKNLCWETARFLHGINFPVMPKVETLILGGSLRFILLRVKEVEKGFFPKGFHIATVFPKLNEIGIFCSLLEKVPDISLSNLLELQDEAYKVKPVQSVRTINFVNCEREVFKKEKPVFSQIFPNSAIVSQSVSR